MYFIENTLKNEIELGTKQCLALYTAFEHYEIKNGNVNVYNVPLPSENLSGFIQELPNTLKDSGFDNRKKTFVLLDKVTSSLCRADFATILDCLNKTLPQGSAICFDYLYSVFNDETVIPARYNYNELEALLDENSFLIYSAETSADFIDYCLAVKH